MFNSTIYGAARWTLPRYFEYDIVNPASTSVEWIRVYVPGPWQPVAENTLGPAPEDSTTYREWRKAYHFEVYWPRDSTGGTNVGSVSQPVSYASFYTWQYRDWITRGYQRLGHPQPSIARPVFASGSPLTRPHVRWTDLFVCILELRWWLMLVLVISGDSIQFNLSETSDFDT